VTARRASTFALAVVIVASGAVAPTATGATRGTVERVVDGDTLRIVERSGGPSEPLRLALVDAPERTAQRYGRAECGGEQATRYLRRLVDGKRVVLRRPGGQRTDRYGRLVREVVIGSRSADEALVRAGWAKPYRVAARSGGAAANRRIARAARAAKKARRGVWRLCGGFGRPAR
jgi:endonuclease YncB( thermonuclease family)